MKKLVVGAQGARAGSVLVGTGLSNRGLRIRIMREQKRGMQGPIEGEFVILDAGDNSRSQALQSLVNRTTDAAEVLRVIRQVYPSCVNVVNAHALVAQESEPEAACSPAATEASSSLAQAAHEPESWRPILSRMPLESRQTPVIGNSSRAGFPVPLSSRRSASTAVQ